MVEVFREVKRVLRDDGTLWLNLGDSYAGNCSQASNNGRAGFGNPRERLVNRKGKGLKPKDLVGIPWRVALALQADGWWLRQDIIWNKPNPMPESVTDRCTKAHEYIFLLSKSPKYYFDHEAIKEPSVTNDPRRPYTSVGAKQLDGRAEWKSGERRDGNDFTKRNRRSVWTVTTKPYKGAHFATFPPDLIAPCILAGSPIGGVVLDPFCGSGTTLEIAERLGRKGVGIELNPDYCELIRERMKFVQPSLLGAIGRDKP
jgi:DNA modification methylase